MKFILHLFIFILCMTCSLPLMSQENCSNGVDDDGDGLIDCYDCADCASEALCAGVLDIACNDYTCEAILAPSSGFVLSEERRTTVGTIATRNMTLAGDVDNDGITELVTLNSAATRFLIYDGATLTLKYNIPISGPDVSNVHAIGDLDGDGLSELLITRYNSTGSRLTCYKLDGSQLWIQSSNSLAPNEARSSPQIADFDGDGNPEIYASNHIFNGQTGALIASGAGSRGSANNGVTSGTNSYTETWPIAADILPDAFCANCSGQELIAGNQIYSVNISGGIMNIEITADNSIITTVGDGNTSIADWDNDGDLDVVVTRRSSGSNCHLYAWDGQTNTVFGIAPITLNTTGLTVRALGRANVGDFDGDGATEACVVSTRIFTAIDNDFSTMWIVNTTDGSSITGTSVFDFEGDGSSEIVYRDETTLRVFDGATGSVLTSTNCISATRNEYPIVGDFDDDGNTEICITCGTSGNTGGGTLRLYASASSPWVPARKVWNQHGYHVTNVNDDLSIPAVPQQHHLVTSLNGFMNQIPPLNNSLNPVYPASDIVPTIVSLDKSKCSNDTILVELSLENTGDQSFPSGTPIAIYSADPTTNTGVLIGTFSNSAVIAAGNSALDTFSINPNALAAPYTLYLIANDTGHINTLVDFANFPVTAIAECDYNNNLISNLNVSCFVPEICGNGQDDDGDGLVDCDDPDCALSIDCYACDAVGLDGADTTWQFVTPEAGYNRAIAYRYTGFDQSITIPTGVTEIDIKAWGAAGGGGRPDVSNRAFGGAGGYAEGVLSVTPSSTVVLIVGEGGVDNEQNTTYGGGGAAGNSTGGSALADGASGGGRSSVQLTSGMDAITSGGGGGGSGSPAVNTYAGFGGGLNGGDGNNFGDGSPGFGGSQTLGGNGGNHGSGSANAIGENGSQFQGGKGGDYGGSGSFSGSGGGGGGGYYGGGGGSGHGAISGSNDAGGGGGSSYIGGVSSGVIVPGFLTVGTIALPGNSNDFHYISNIGVGGNAAEGGHGLIVIQYRDTSITEICGNGCDDDGDGFIDNNDLDCNDCTTLCDTTTNKRFEVTPGDATIVNYIWTVNNGAVITSGQGTTAITVNFTGVTVGNLVNLCVSYTDNNGCTSDPFCDQITIEDCCVPLPAPASIECD